LIRLPQDVLSAIEEGGTVVVPSQQRAEAVHRAYAAHALAGGRKVWPTPDVLPLEVWATKEIERRCASGERLSRLLTPAEDWLLWRQCTGPLTDEMQLVARGPLADALRRAHQLAIEYGIDLHTMRAPPGSEGRLLIDVSRAVAERSREMGATTPAQLAADLACVGGSRDVLFAGFERVTPRLAMLTTSRGAAGCVTKFRAPPALDGKIAHARAVLAGDPSEELERIADWCRTRLTAQPDSRLLVIVPGSPEAQERLLTLIRQNIDPVGAALAPLAALAGNPLAEMAGGAPLARSPLAAYALQSLTWLSSGSEFAEFSAWLCSPHWTIPAAGRASLDLWLRERSPLDIDTRKLLTALERVPRALQPVASELRSRITDAASKLSGGATTPRQWSMRFRKALDALNEMDSRALSSAESQTYVRFVDLLDDFGGLESSAGTISRDTAVQWLRELAARTSFRPASGDALVTISSQLTDPIVRYDGLWVSGLHADAWPVPAQPDPFIPLQAQLSAGVPAASAAGRGIEARNLMAAWAAACDELVLSAPLRDDDVQLSPSPQILKFAGSVEDASSAPSVWLPQRLRRAGLTELVDDASGRNWDVARSLPSGTRSVELQNLCPFRAYAELRLGSAPLEAPEPGVAPDVRGKLLHTALEKLWGQLHGSEALLRQSDESLRDLITRSVEEAALVAFGLLAGDTRAAAEQREMRRAVRLIYALCDLEKKRGPFNVRQMERESVLRIAGAQMTVRIDRVDEVDGGLAILDYKSGRPIPGDWYSERPSHPQLLAYLAAIGRETQAMATISVTAREIRFDGVAAHGSLLPKVRAVEAPTGPESAGNAWATRQEEWIGRVEQLASDFIAGHASVDPRPKACEYCQVVSVCRISDEGADAVERNVDE
jgi:ATP-dependent helicase/nuclease subunit B